jgi:hypothetical protein
MSDFEWAEHAREMAALLELPVRLNQKRCAPHDTQKALLQWNQLTTMWQRGSRCCNATDMLLAFCRALCLPEN